MATDHDQHDQDIADSIATAVERARAPLNCPTEAEMIAARVEQRMVGAAATSPPPLSQPSTAQLVRANAERDAAELNYFAQTVAAFFDCPSLLSDQLLVKLRPAFQELRAMSARLNAQAARRGAPIGMPPGRDAGGKFVGRR